MAIMAKCKGSLCIILQELPLSVKTTASTAAHFDARGETIGIISDAGLVSLLKVGTEEVCTDILDGLAISQFVWDSAVIDSKLQTMQMFAVITKDSQVQLHRLQEEGQSFVQEKIAGCSFEVVTTALGTFVGTDFSSPVDLRVLSLQGSLLTVLIDTTVCRLALSDDGAVEILQSYNIGIPVQEISQTRVIQGMLVVLQNVGIISFHSLDKKEKVAVVCIQEYISQRHSTSSSHEDIGTEFKHFAISEDLINLVVCDSRENLIPIDLNAYFHHNQQNLLRKNRRDRVGVPGEAGQCEGDGPSYLEKRNRYRNISTDNNRKWVNQLDHMRMRSTHRFSCSGVLSGRRGVGVPTIHHRTNKRSQNWYENAEGVRMTTKWVRTCNDDSAKTFSDDKVVHGFMRRNRRMSRQSQDVQCSQLTVPDTSVTLPSSVDKEAMTVSRLYISGASVSAWYTARPGTETHAVQSAVCMFDLCSGQQELCEFREPACVVFSPINTHPHLIVMGSAIATVMFNEEQEAFVNKLMMYDSATVADSVCRVNRWDRCSIPIHALEVGLRHRQLDTVAFFLKSRETGAAAGSPFRSQMDTFQLESAVELLIATIKDNINGDMQSKLFGEQLLHMTLEFVNHLMRNATSQAQVQEEETGSVDEDLKNSIDKVIKYLSELRKYQKDVPEQLGQKVTSKQDVQVEKSEDFQYYMPDKSNFTDRRLESWKHMTRQEIIQDGILNSCIPLVQAHLHRHDKTTVRSQPSRLKDILDAGLSEVYQFLLQRNLRTSAKMLNNMGFDVTEQLRRLCLYTSNRTLRDFLIEELEKSKQLTEEELKMVQFVQKLERLYTCRSYERAKEMAEETRKSYWENTHRLSRTPTMQAKSILSSLIKTGDLEPSDPMNYDSDGYSHVILEWVRTWDEETKQRILLDRVFHSNDSSLLTTFDPKTRWQYLLSHNLWDKICQWINEDSSEITAEMLNDMSHCTTYVKDRVLDEMARRGLFSSEELASFEKLLHRLSRSGSLMVKPHTLSKSTILSVDDFNAKFIGFCLQHCLPNVLYFYLDFFRIAVTSEETQQLLSAYGDVPWFEMLLFFREVGMKYKDPTAMFCASLANSRLLQNSPRTVSALLEANRPLAAMATLVYAPGTLNEVTLPVENEKDRLWKVNPELLQKSLLAYPKLQSALFPVQTADGVVAQDITMYQLLKGNSPFDPSRLFRWQSTNNMSTQNNGGEDVEIPHFARSDLVSKYGHKEVLRYTYYLRRGRPSFAFITFVKSLGDSDASQIKKRMKQAYWKAYMVALTNFTNSAICAACTTFSEMLGHDSLAIRVDIQSSNLIYSHQKKMADKITDKKTKQQKVKDTEEDIVSDFMSLLRHRRNCAEKILAELENAIVESIKNSDEESTSLETSQQWSLAVLFCHLHKLPYTSVYLRECAEDNQWLRFLCFAQNYQYPQKQVLELVRNFQDANIREHLQHAWNTYSTPAMKDSSNRGNPRKPGNPEISELSI
ncbi:spatacsin-like isoform X2 [Ptychodera flava]|uniref:spatacsin-like isoform X2 n=1 Tax=Ptychodera flava TaxID=63121 RepID=UPI00396A078A